MEKRGQSITWKGEEVKDLERRKSAAGSGISLLMLKFARLTLLAGNRPLCPVRKGEEDADEGAVMRLQPLGVGGVPVRGPLMGVGGGALGRVGVLAVAVTMGLKSTSGMASGSAR